MPRMQLLNTIELNHELDGLAWSPDSKLLVTTENFGREIRVWKSAGLTAINTFRKNRGAGSGRVLFLRDGQSFLTSPDSGPHDDAALVVVDANSGKPLYRLKGPNDPNSAAPVNFPEDFSLSRNGQFLYVAFSFPHINPTICAYETNAWTMAKCWPSKGGVFAMAPGRDDNELITANATGEIQIWNTSQKVITRAWVASSEALRSLATDSQLNWIAGGGGASGQAQDEKRRETTSLGEVDTVRLWDIRNGKLERSVAVGLEAPALNFSRGAQYLAVLSTSAINRSSLSIYHVPDLRTVKVLRDIQGTPRDVRFSDDGARLAIGVGSKVFLYSFEETEIK